MQFAGEYFAIESNRDSMMTVTRADIFDRGKRAVIYFTAIPEEKEELALNFAKRKRQDFRKFVMSKKSFGFVPKIDFEIDLGEHNRQKIDELLRTS
jgi:ribosome-binding factor A